MMLWGILGLFLVIGGIGNLFKGIKAGENANAKKFGVVTAVGAMLLMYGVGSSKPADAQGPAHSASSQTQKAPLSKSQALANFRIGNFRWEKGGFGSVMVATFVIYNNNDFPVKDVQVTCLHSTNSDTPIDRNTRTAYEVIGPHGYFSVQDANMGFVHSSATRSRCDVTDFTRI